MVGKRIIKVLVVGTILSGVTTIACTSLGSCTFSLPYLKLPKNNAAHMWRSNTYFDLSTTFNGYYFDDVSFPGDNNDDIHYNGHQTDVTLDRDPQKTYKQWSNSPNPSKKVGVINLHFIVNTTKDNPTDTFSFSISWHVNHTLVNETTNVILKGQSSSTIANDLTFSDQTYATESTAQLSTGGNSIQILNGIYTSSSSTDANSIQRNLENDFLYYTYLLLGNIKHLYLNDSFIPLYADYKDKYSGDIRYEYNFNTGVFTYLGITLSAEMEVGVQDCTLNYFYYWGGQWDIHNVNDNSVITHVDLGDGPKLMGAYTLGENIDKYNGSQMQLSHRSQNKDFTEGWPYKQNFLSLVPSSPTSYVLYDCIVPAKIAFYSLTFGSGYHMYFMDQPILAGLEFSDREKHITVAPPYKTIGGHTDDFRHLGLSIPSYTLSGIGVNNDKQYYQHYPRPKIDRCRVDIDTKPPVLANKIGVDSKYQFFQNWFRNNQYNDAGDWFKEYDGSISAKAFDPTDWINSKKAEITKEQSCVGALANNKDWGHITIYFGPTQVGDNIPWYQVLQEFTNYCYYNDEFTPYATYIPDTSSQHSQTMPIDTTRDGSDKFVSFGMSLNYMFTCDALVDLADNVFQYNATNVDFINTKWSNS